MSKRQPHTSRTVAHRGNSSRRSIPMTRLTFPLGILCLLVLSLALTPQTGRAADTNLSLVVTGRIEETNSQEILRTYLQLQEQIHATQLALEQNRKDARDAAAQSAETLASRLQSIEQALATQRARELQAMQSSNKVMLIVAGSFAAVGFIAMVLMAYFQWRAVNSLAEISSVLPAGRGFGPGSAMAALGSGEAHLITAGAAEQSNLRLLGAMEQLEKRIHDLEHTSRPPSQAGLAETSHANGNGDSLRVHDPLIPPASSSSENGSDAAHIAMLLGKGQSMLSLDKAEAALACFEEALSLDPDHTEALVKKGAALEKLQRLAEAISTYDQAIATDASMTIAYLHKGGLCNRMERFNEALECYEQALRTQERHQA